MIVFKDEETLVASCFELNKKWAVSPPVDILKLIDDKVLGYLVNSLFLIYSAAIAHSSV